MQVACSAGVFFDERTLSVYLRNVWPPCWIFKEEEGCRPRGGTWVKFCWVCAAGISEPLSHYSLFLVFFVANYKPHLSHFWANDFLTLKVPKKCDPILVTLLKMLEKATPL